MTPPSTGQQLLTDPAPRRRTSVTVEELRRAWGAVQNGRFLDQADPAAGGDVRQVEQDEQPLPDSTWKPDPGERVLPVLGCLSGCGSSTLAVAVAEAAASSQPGQPGGDPRQSGLGNARRLLARVVECASSARSGLDAASDSELGHHPSGWVRGARGQVLLERCADPLVDVRRLPIPTAQPGLAVTVLDAASGLRLTAHAGGWLDESIRRASTVVLVSAVTIPGLRALETDLELLGDHRHEYVVALAGPQLHRTRRVVATAGPRTRDLIRAERIVQLPASPALAQTGLTPQPLPRDLAKCAGDVLRLATEALTSQRSTPRRKAT